MNNNTPFITQALINSILQDASGRAFRLSHRDYSEVTSHEFWEDDPLGNKTVIEVTHYHPTAKDRREFYTLDWTAPDCFGFGEDIYTANRRINVTIDRPTFDYCLSCLMPRVIRKAA